MRRTSIEVYQKIQAMGLLSQLRFEVYEVLVNHGPLTAGEVWDRFFKNKRQRSSISARMSELEERAVVYVKGLSRVIGIRNTPCCSDKQTDVVQSHPAGHSLLTCSG